MDIHDNDDTLDVRAGILGELDGLPITSRLAMAVTADGVTVDSLAAHVVGAVADLERLARSGLE